MTEPVRLGLVGCGRLAESGYVPACARAAGVTLSAVADPDPTRRARALASCPAAHDVAEFPDAAALLAGADVDAVVLATPASAHVADAALAAGRGVPVLVEKPPAPDAAGAAQLVALGPLVRLGFNRRFDPGAQAVRAAVPTDGLIHLELEIRYRRASWNAHTVRDEVLLDLVPHLVDWARWLSGSEPAGVATSRLEPDRVALELTLGRGRATIDAAADRLHRERIEVTDRTGAVVARHRVGGLAAAVLGQLRPATGPHPLEASLTAQLEAFARTVRRDGPDELLGTATDGHVVMTVIDAARASAARGGHLVPVADPRENAPC